MDFIALTDVPELTAGSGGKVRARIPVARLDSYKDRRYGEFAITAKDAASWQRNLDQALGGQVPIDYDHGPERGQGSEAAAWITGLTVEGDKVMGDVEFTPQGAQAVRDGRWKFISPTFKDNYVDEQGKGHGPALIGAGLTNRPFLKRGMPAICLSEDLDPEQTFAVSDSRGRMTFIADIAKTLSLPADADEGRILAHLGDVKVLSTADHTTLIERAEAGDEAVKTLAETTFKSAWDKALDDKRVIPAQEDDYRALYESNADATLKLLSVTAEVPGAPATKPAGEGKQPAEAPEGVDPERNELHERVKTLATSAGITYDEALTRVLDESPEV